jgi:SHAQKYF class myb-like DNA-binding protein
MFVHAQNTGRWTYGEHCLFLKGLEQHGKGWKKIASLIRTRTVVQIRTHAQKYFQKLAKAKQNGDHGDVSMDSKGGGKRRHRNKRKVTITNTCLAHCNSLQLYFKLACCSGVVQLVCVPVYVLHCC